MPVAPRRAWQLGRQRYCLLPSRLPRGCQRQRLQTTRRGGQPRCHPSPSPHPRPSPSPSSPCSCCATWPCTGSCSRVRKRRHSQRSRSGRSEAAELRGPGGCIAAYACRMYVKQAIPGKSTTDTASEQREYELLSSAWQQELPTAAAAVPVPPQEGSSCQAGRQAGHPVPLGPFRPRPASRMLPLLQACGRGGASWAGQRRRQLNCQDQCKYQSGA